jgi:hypothetical protein
VKVLACVLWRSEEENPFARRFQIFLRRAISTVSIWRGSLRAWWGSVELQRIL